MDRVAVADTQVLLSGVHQLLEDRTASRAPVEEREPPSRAQTCGLVLAGEHVGGCRQFLDDVPEVGEALVSGVLPGSSAAAAGITAGDTLVSVNGAAMETMDPYERPFRLAAGRDGDRVTVEVDHEGAVTSHELIARDLLTAPTLP